MSNAAIRAGRRGPSAPANEGTRWKTWAGLVALLLVATLLAAWLLGWLSFGTDPRVAEILVLQEQARAQFAATGGPQTIVEATAAATTMNTIRAKAEALPPHLRQQVERQGSGMFRSAMRARIDAYFTTQPEQRQALLDRQIDQEEMLRKAFEAGQAVAGMVGGVQQGGGQAGGGQQPGGQATSSPPAGGPPRGGTEEDRNRWRKSMIDRTTPEQRARYVEYRRAMDERREQRGLPNGWGR
ncbi:MAG: hypothetical protein ACKOC8_04525 [Pirellulales bacterium]